MLAFGQARLRARRRDGGVDRYGMFLHRDRLRPGIAAARAGVGHHAFLRAGRGRRDFAFVPIMVECGDDFLLDKYFFADGAMLAFGQARLRARRRDGGIDHFGVTFRLDRARLRLAAARAGVGHHAFLRTGRGRRDFALVPGVADDLALDMFAAEFRVAAAAIYDGIVRAWFFAGGSLLVLAHRFGRGVAERIDRLRPGIAAARAGVGHHAFLRAGRGRRDFAFVPIMVERGDDFLLDKYFVTDGAMLAFRQARLRAGRRDGGVDRFGVTCRLDRARLRLPARAGALLFPLFRARRGDSHDPFAEVVFVWLVGIVRAVGIVRIDGIIRIVGVVRIDGIIRIVGVVRIDGIARIIGLLGMAALVVRALRAGDKADDAGDRHYNDQQYYQNYFPLFHALSSHINLQGAFSAKTKKACLRPKARPAFAVSPIVATQFIP